MHRPLAFLVLFCSLQGCDTVPTLKDTRLQVAPYLSEYKLRGKTSMSTISGSTNTPNPAVAARDFGLGAHEDDVGVRVDLGDGFAGARLDYYRMSADTSRRHPLPANWGQMQTNDLASMATVMDEYRVGFAQEVLRQKFDFRNLRDVEVRLAPQVIAAHRSLSFHANEDTKTRFQNLHASDKLLLYPGLRSRLAWQNVSLDLEYAYKPHGFDLGGDFQRAQQDLEVRVTYEFEMHGIEVFAGYRRSELNLRGDENGQDYDADFVLDGLQFGVRVEF